MALNLTRALLKSGIPRCIEFQRTEANGTNSGVYKTSCWRLATNTYGWPLGSVAGSLNGAVCNSATTGAFPLPTPASGNRFYFQEFDLRSTLYTAPKWFMDRLWHNVFSVNTTSAQAITFPGLTRYTTGAGVELWAEITTVFDTGTATFTASVSYTNQDGTAGRAGAMTCAITGTNMNIGGAVMPVTLDTGDTGVRSVESVTVSSTHVSGVVSLFLAKPLFSILAARDIISRRGQFPKVDPFLILPSGIDPAACIMMLSNSEANNSSNVLKGTIKMIELEYP